MANQRKRQRLKAKQAYHAGKDCIRSHNIPDATRIYSGNNGTRARVQRLKIRQEYQPKTYKMFSNV